MDRRDIDRIVGDLGTLVQEWQSKDVISSQQQEEMLRSLDTLHGWAETDQRDRQARSIIETTLDAFIAVDRQGKIVTWNPQAERIFGWRREQVIGQTLLDLIVPESHRETHAKGVLRCLVQGEGGIENDRIEVIGQRKDGSEFPIELTIYQPTQTVEATRSDAIVCTRSPATFPNGNETMKRCVNRSPCITR